VGPDYSHILDRVGARPARRPLTWIARCPVHRDRTPSLSLWIGREGQLLANCWTCRCGWRALVTALNTKPADWFPPKGEGFREHSRVIVATYDYRDEGGTLLYQKVRYCPKAFRLRRWDGSGWKWDLKGIQRVPYRLPELLAKPEEPVCVVEGEKDVDALHKLGILAVCNDDGAENWTLEHGRWLVGGGWRSCPTTMRQDFGTLSRWRERCSSGMRRTFAWSPCQTSRRRGTSAIGSHALAPK
jgi:hypothetical protein